MKRKNTSIICISLALLLLLLCSCKKTGLDYDTANTNETLSTSQADINTDVAGSESTGSIDTDNVTDTPIADKITIIDHSFEYSLTQKQSIYKRAEQAVDNKEYHYAYSLFAVLSRQGYKDSTKRELELLKYQNATQIVQTTLDKVAGGENCSLSVTPENADKIDGLLYIGEGGTPRFIYQDNDENITEIIPDTKLTDVLSLCGVGDFGDFSPRFFICIKYDGSIELLYSPSVIEDFYRTKEWLDTFYDFEQYCENLQNVAKIWIYSDSASTEACFLHNDGSMSVYANEKYCDTSVLQKLKQQKDLVDIYYDLNKLCGLRADGSLVQIIYHKNDKLYPSGINEVDSDRRYLTYSPGGWLNDWFFEMRCNEGMKTSEGDIFSSLQSLTVEPTTVKEDGNEYYILQRIYNCTGYLNYRSVRMDINGGVWFNGEGLPSTTDGIAGFISVKCPQYEYAIAITNEGKVIHEISNSKNPSNIEFEELFKRITVYVK